MTVLLSFVLKNIFKYWWYDVLLAKEMLYNRTKQENSGGLKREWGGKIKEFLLGPHLNCLKLFFFFLNKFL